MAPPRTKPKASPEPNTWAKTRPLERPYRTIVDGDWEYRILKAWQSPAKERANPYARLFCAVRSPMTFGSWDYGDTYAREIPGYTPGDRRTDAELEA